MQNDMETVLAECYFCVEYTELFVCVKQCQINARISEVTAS